LSVAEYINSIQTSEDNSGQKEQLHLLIAACLENKQAAQRKLYETYAPATWNVIKRYVFEHEAAQEILNDTYYKVFARLEQYEYKGSFEGWIRKIAVNTIVDYLRKYIPKKGFLMSQTYEENAWVAEEAVSKINFKELVSFTYRIPDMHRAVFNLSVFENLSHKEIAAALQISEGNSRWILNDARKKLKEIIMKHT
jgi:RNA polymerase sigma-70 factor (ECF subfamily)